MQSQNEEHVRDQIAKELELLLNDEQDIVGATDAIILIMEEN